MGLTQSTRPSDAVGHAPVRVVRDTAPVLSRLPALGVQSRGQVDRFAREQVWLAGPNFADGLERCEAAKGLEPFGEVVGVQERAEVLSELPVGFVVVAPHGRLLEGTVHALDLAIGPRVVGLGEAMLDVVLATDAIKHVQTPTGGRSGPA